jgi:23S rRNA-/tRNA-specific pseudouridylate synthase
MDTFGLMVLARNSLARRNLSLRFAKGLVHKQYIALQ